MQALDRAIMKIVCFMNTLSLGHMARILEVARELRVRGHEIVMAGPAASMKIFTEDQFRCVDLVYLTSQQVKQAAHEKGWSLIFSYERMRQFVEAEVQILKQEKPDLVMIDYRFTARTAADILKIPTVALLNVHMSNYRKYPLLSAGHFFSIDSFLGRIFSRMLIFIENIFYQKLFVDGVNRIRKEYGLPRLYAHDHDHGDLTLFADDPEFNPIADKSRAECFVGPLVWQNHLPAPQGLELLDRRQKTVYWAAGSVASNDYFKLIDQMGESQFQFIVSVGLNERGQSFPSRPGVLVVPMANTDVVLPHCDIVCCHGGNGTIYQALAHGLPVLGLADHDEQYYNILRLKQCGLGMGYSPEETKKLKFSDIVLALEATLSDAAILSRVKLFKEKLKIKDSPRLAADKIEFFVASRH